MSEREKDEKSGRAAPGQPLQSLGWFTAKVQDGTLALLNGDRPTCLPADKAATLQKAMGVDGPTA
jgi:hypothetical protein